MTHLKLHNCSIHFTPTFKIFNELVSLELCEVTISSELLHETLILCSPMLEKLLRSLDFTGDIEFLSLTKVPFLVKLSLVATGPSVVAGEPDRSKYFEDCPALERLFLDYGSIQFLFAGSCDMATKLSSPLNCLKYLCLSNICLHYIVGLSCALCLIRSSPYLQDIQMKIGYDDKFSIRVTDDAVTKIPSTFSGVTLNHLRSVKLEGITGKKPEMELVKLLLAKSPLLLRMLIQPRIWNESAETRLKVIAEITKFPRASPKAEVDYNVDNNQV
ncbi:hypothetical protein R3W88_014181 [Solanum pinnatisectum]|uniref:FBD domain-containing protein n=1 Tax=Solanum pinnatisectum TaxID=50273 RepID=A0AAV9KSA0_9SOLN|nr:hypothetical protein R3W88_014181 [Solanum pinnatisectum]